MVSVIVTVFNVGEYVSQCLESICNQTYKDIEVIVVNDGSRDRSGDVCDEFAQRDGRIQVIHKKNQGLVRARKDGLLASKGEYVTYVDGDDWIEPDMLRVLVETIEQERVDIVVHGRFFDIGEKSIMFYQGFPQGRYNRERLEREIYLAMIVNKGFMDWGIYPNVWDKLFKREILFESQMAVDEMLTMGEDAACVYPCLLKADSMYILGDCFYHYRQNTTSMVRSRRTAECEREMYRRLYFSVKRSLLEYKNEYRLIDQWKDYMLFLMIPRADVLYEEIEKKDYLFPYPEIKKGDSVIIYGAGVYGKRLYQFLKDTGFCNVKAIADRDYENLSMNDMKVISPDEMDNLKFDHVIVAISFEKARNAVKDDLIKRFGEDKISTMNMEIIRSDETWKAFGMA